MSYTLIILWIAFSTPPNGPSINMSMTSEKIEGYSNKTYCGQAATEITDAPRPDKIRAVAYCVPKG